MKFMKFMKICFSFLEGVEVSGDDKELPIPRGKPAGSETCAKKPEA
jgi:hypothetical protein